ncbi:uncharacterized protein V1518DRAFT_428529 [Limtongia smithiae]|uniref:uncharacterized protein n=1 Tax=Limtongia smithiae TaxID=1125753 RepID=UPI0034CD0B0A
MATDVALLASRVAVSVAQTRALVASWVDGSADGARGGNQVDKGDDADAPSIATSDGDNNDNEDEDHDFTKKYTVITGRGGIGTPAPDNDTTIPVNSSATPYRQRKTLEFMQKQILKRKAAEAAGSSKAGATRPADHESEEEDESESRTSVLSRRSTETKGKTGTEGTTDDERNSKADDVEDGDNDAQEMRHKKQRTQSVLDEVLTQRKQHTNKKKKKKKKKKPGT